MVKSIQLKKDAERRIYAGHLWIFSNDIDTKQNSLKNFHPGEIIFIETALGKSIAIGYINPYCLLCVRILTHSIHEKINVDFFIKKIHTASLKRQCYFNKPFYRVVFGESDYLPGLVIDQFNDIIVAQFNTAGMESLKTIVIEAIQRVFNPNVLILKCDSTERHNEQLNSYIEIIHGTLPDTIKIEENNCEYHIPVLQGQKTGWFYDHRTTRSQIVAYCNQKNVLDVFSYFGAFSLLTAKQGAKSVVAIDSSAFALDVLKKNAQHQKLNNIATLQGDALSVMLDLKNKHQSFDVIILDPPAFIKRKKDVKNGLLMYQKVNEAALKLLKPNGILCSASCSMHLSAADLLNCIRRAGIKTKRSLSVLEQCHQSIDHPIHPAIAETNYLKGFILFVE